MTPEEELALLRMENDFLRRSRDQWKIIAAAYEAAANRYKVIVDTFTKGANDAKF